MNNQNNVHFHLQLLQNVISRMAANSASAKTWCVALVSALLVLLAEKGSNDFNVTALIPVLLLYSVDVYYLALEKGFQKTYNDFVDKLHANNIKERDFYIIRSTGKSSSLRLEAIKSLSTTGFYCGMVLLVLSLGCFL